MSDFDEAVRAALESLLIQQQGEDSPNPNNWDSGYAAHQAKYLAPRVAAAIHDAVEEFARSADDPANDSATWEAAALAALRGIRT